MTPNMGTADRSIRTLLAVVFFVLYVAEVVTGTLGILLVVFGVVFVATSVVSFCPLYLPFGISTRPKAAK